MILQKEIKNLNDGEKLKFVKNLLESFGIKTKLKRTGDVNMRIDAIGQLPKNKTAIFSIEFGNDSLSLPRKILENFAILHRRYNKDKNNIIPFAIVNEVPNKRSEYYRVLGDVYKVTKIKIYTLSIFNLILWVKNKKKISDFIFDDFFITNKKNNKFIIPKK